MREDRFEKGFDAGIEFALDIIAKSPWGTEDVYLQLQDEYLEFKKDLIK